MEFLRTTAADDQLVCVANCNFVIHRTCRNFTSARCMLFIVKALLILAKHTIGLVLLSVVMKNPPTAWVIVGIIYQVRLSMKRGTVR
jgi:hypothetical protein